ncbi:MAG: hypothetical protein L0Z55_01355 [Planctomycetes bacterium]|nr:hypothetical protein [Planctomycetota bacterium]
MTQSFDIKEVISKSTSDVAIDDLAKKGFRKVKVLNKDAINQLIADAVERVIGERMKEATQSEREQLQKDSRAEFDRMLRDQQKSEALLKDLENEFAQLEAEATRLRAELAQREQELTELRNKTMGSSDLQSIKDSIEKLHRRIGHGAAAASDYLEEGADTEFAIRAALSNTGDSAVESNVNKVEVTKKKASGVSSTLDKLRSLQKGGKG